MASVELRGLSKSFGRTQAVRDVTLDIADREFVVFIGPSGCGKSTLLRMIAGLEDITSGSLRIGGREMGAVPAADRGVAMVFQSYALYPHMSVRQNIGFGLMMAGMPAAEVARKVDGAAETLQIGELLDRRPRELSGGQRQRVAIGRAIVKEPAVFLFDEPLSNLDADLRSQMRAEIARLHKAIDTTVIYVTHDQVEAMTLADRIVVMRDGVVEQDGAPAALYDRPANLFVATFLGQPKINLLAAVAAPAQGGIALTLASGAVIKDVAFGARIEGPVTFAIRPDDVRVRERGAGSGPAGTVELVEYLGPVLLVHVRLENAPELVVAALPKAAPVAVGDAVTLDFAVRDGHVFWPDGRRVPCDKTREKTRASI